VRRYAVLGAGTVVLVVAAIASAGPAGAVARPTLMTLSSSSGRTAGGARLTITGTGFARGTTVHFGSASGRSVKVLSGSRLHVTTPPHQAGRVDVTVTRSGSTSTRHTADHYTFVSPPSVSSITPAAGLAAGGSRVTVHGANFTHVTSVTFGSTKGTAIAVASSGLLAVTAPSESDGIVDVRVTTSYGTSSAHTADRFTYRDAPAPVTDFHVADAGATSVVLRWAPPAPTEPGADVALYRAAGTQPPASPSAGTLVATTPAGVLEYADTGLTRDTPYSYSAFVRVSGGAVLSAPASLIVVTPHDSHPDTPAGVAVTPTPRVASGDPCGGQGWVGLTSQLTVSAYLDDPDGDRVTAHFRLLDLGATGDATPAITATADSAAVLGHGLALARIDTSSLTGGTLYDVEATADDGTSTSASGAPCRFRYDDAAPAAPTITSPDVEAGGSTPTGKSISFTVTAPGSTFANGVASPVDHVEYAWGSSSYLQAWSGPYTHDSGNTTTSISYTPTDWGQQTLYVAAVDQAGNRSATVSFSFYVSG
jgi:IPT/TIG domain-containing protein